MSTFSPLCNSDRLTVMDALRGFSLLGIFIANIPGFNFFARPDMLDPAYTTSWDNAFTFLDHMFLEGKFYSIFSLLFGWGLAIQMQRREENKLKPVSFARRRLFFMLLLGLAHIVLLWVGDIVAFYAMLGFVLLAIRKCKDRTLFITAVVLILLPVLLYYLKMVWSPIRTPEFFLRETAISVDEKITGITSFEEYLVFVSGMDYFDLVKSNIAGFFWRYQDLFFQSRIPKVLGMFILGYLLGRNGRYKSLIKNYKLLLIIGICGLAIGLPANFYMAGISSGDYYDLKQQGFYKTIAYALGVAPLAIGYVAFFFLLGSTGFGKRMVQVLSPVGRMAFSNYIFQSIVATIFFLPFGLNMLGKLGSVHQALFAITVFFLQVLISSIWLHYFQFGPVEWLWRSATYKKAQSFSKKKALNNPGDQAKSLR